MARAFRIVLTAIVLIALLGLALPWIDTGLYAMRLASMEPPTALAMPVANVKPAGLRDTWHASRPPARRHEGIDIFAKRGTPVVSASEGIFLRRGESNLGGKVVWVLGPAGHRHYYAHLDDYAYVTVGERVKPGTVLGYVGNTGNARTTPPHLHYGVYTSGGPVNPYPLLVQKSKPPQSLNKESKLRAKT